MTESKLWWIPMGIICVLLVTIIIGVICNDYRRGQIDALNGIYHYERVITSDGCTNYIKLKDK